jgi:hypothetical protein
VVVVTDGQLATNRIDKRNLSRPAAATSKILFVFFFFCRQTAQDASQPNWLKIADCEPFEALTAIAAQAK